MGTYTTAGYGWELILVKPQLARFCCLAAIFTATVLTVPIYTFASQPYRWLHHSLTFLYGISHCTVFVAVWRSGANAADCWPVKLGMYGALVTHPPATLLMLLGPIEYCIFQDRLALIIVSSTFNWLTTCSAFLGCWAPDRPKQPYRCARAPLPLHLCCRPTLILGPVSLAVVHL